MNGPKIGAPFRFRCCMKFSDRKIFRLSRLTLSFMAMISSFDVLFLGALALLVFYLYMTWNFNYWKKRGIDSDDKVSVLFGSFTDAFFGKKPFGEIFSDLYKKFPGKKVVGYLKFRSPALIIRDPGIIRKVLITDFNYFLNNDVTVDPDADPIMGKNIFFLKDAQWKKARALVTPAFTAGKIKAIYPVMQDVARELVTYLKQHPEEIHVKSVLSRYTTEIVARCALGIEGNNFKHAKPEMHELGKLIWEMNFIKNLKITATFLMPTITKLLRLRMVPDRVIEFFKSVLLDVIVYRQENKVVANDLVQYFIEVKRKSLEVAKGNMQSEILTEVYTDEDVLSGCIMFFVEAYETTAITLTNVLYQLALHKDVQEKLRNEVDEALADGELSFEKLHAMNYLHSVYAETHRVLPVLYSMQKLCTERYEMDIGRGKPLVIEKGMTVVIPLHALHTDPLYWEDASKFIPERFSKKEDEAKAKSEGIYMPFSDGPRVCPGSRIATTMIKLAVVNILSQMEIVPTKRTPKELDPDPQSFMIVHKSGIYLRFVERSH